MTVYVLGAGASVHAGYPLASNMAEGLLGWMERDIHDPDTYAGRYPHVADYLRSSFQPIGNIEDLIARIRKQIRGLAGGTAEQRAQRASAASAYGALQNAVRDWFGEIQRGPALKSPAYREFAQNVVAEGDCIISFNYDVSLERELRCAGKFEIGDGYGFSMEGLPAGSKTTVLKLHGSTNWLALLFGGQPRGFSSFQPGNALSSPVIGGNELSFLGYKDTIDPRFKSGGAALPVIIFPAPLKEFYFDVNTGVEYRGFWDRLWSNAEHVLERADSVVVCGYSLLPVDERACDLLLRAPRKQIEILVASGGDTPRVVEELEGAGYSEAAPSSEPLFERWVALASAGVAPVH